MIIFNLHHYSLQPFSFPFHLENLLGNHAFRNICQTLWPQILQCWHTTWSFQYRKSGHVCENISYAIRVLGEPCDTSKLYCRTEKNCALDSFIYFSWRSNCRTRTIKRIRDRSKSSILRMRKQIKWIILREFWHRGIEDWFRQSHKWGDQIDWSRFRDKNLNRLLPTII